MTNIYIYVKNKMLIFSGKLTMVVGKIGSGKTSLLSAMLGEIHCIRGTVSWDK